jgi:hypothetical protein
MTIARMKYSLIASLFADPTVQGAGEIGEILAEAEPEKALS